ncbi:hypothetical protein [Okeania sp.]|uniref:hypothetical protein n=1 Tax=Okeania sp. TaxID=3100323 RepID=UPI002B4ABBA7|nr:hypothetical protein [Okeania sp.]MEB3340896.1 hypothetical protein [Okeania sp.]
MIYTLKTNTYILVSNSRYFPLLNVAEIVVEYLQLARQESSSVAMPILRKNFPNANS